MVSEIFESEDLMNETYQIEVINAKKESIYSSEKDQEQ